MSANPETNEQAPKGEKPLGTWMSLIGAVAAIGAWSVMMSSEKASFWCAVIGLVLSCFGLKSDRRGWRNLSVTAIIASGVLLLVYGIFWGAIFFTMKNLQ